MTWPNLFGIRLHVNQYMPKDKVLILGGGPPLRRDMWLWDLLTGEIHGPTPFNAAHATDIFMREIPNELPCKDAGEAMKEGGE